MDLLQHLINPLRGGAPGQSKKSFLSAIPATSSVGETSPHTRPPATSHVTEPDIFSLDDFTAQCASRPPTHTITRPTVIPLGKARTGEHVSALYLLCAKRNITPSFDYTERSLSKFGGKLFLNGTVVEDHGPYASKKEAKDAVAEKGCLILRAMPDPATQVSQNQQHMVQEQQPENWIGLILEYSNATGMPQASYQDYQAGAHHVAHFACEMTISKRPDEPFGGQDKLYSTKKAARAAAAREAVQWLRQTGEMSATAGHPRKKARLSSHGGGGGGGGGSGSSEESGTAAVQKAPSFAQQVNDMCPTLNLSGPTYQLHPSSPDTLNIFSGAAYFARNPEMAAGPIGEVRHVFGKKNAREAIAKGVLRVLKDEAARKLAGLPVARAL